MSTAEVLTPLPKLVTDEFGDTDHYEIIDGVKMELPPMSADAQFLASRLVVHLSNYGLAQNIGEACTEVLFKLPLPVDRNRRPDAAFIPYSRWPKNSIIPSTNAWDVLPELCVEVVSPTDEAGDLRIKVDEYLSAGVRQVWVIYPRLRIVDVFEKSGPGRTLHVQDTLDGGPVLPGFTLKLAEFFPEPEPPPAPRSE